jgi:hypothetical protein
VSLRIGVLGLKMGLSLVGGCHGPWPEADPPCPERDRA